MNSLYLNGKSCVITGATRGIGRCIAETFSKYGSNVALIARSQKEGKIVTDKLNSSSAMRNIFYKCDVSSREQVRKTCKKILSDFKKVDILVLNAGISIRETLDNPTYETWDNVIGVHLNGSFYFIRNLIKKMISEKNGNVIIISSVSATTGSGGGVHYPAAKAGLIGIAKGICYELLGKGIRANIISPGCIATSMLREKYPNTEDGNRLLNEQVPIGRAGTPQDVANLALFLASDMSSYICGQEILIDGGRTFYTHPIGS